MLRYRDFVPRVIDAGGLFREGVYESFDEAVAAANEWLATGSVRLLKIETVVLPNIHSRWEKGANDSAIHTSGDSPSIWHQFLRVWYQDES